jgi:hypothetical protein
MKKTNTCKSLFISTCILASSSMLASNDICKHNAIHFATSVEDISYVENLLVRKEFNLKEFNKQCQTVFHIATELGNIELLEIFYKELGTLNIENIQKENLIQAAIKYKQPEVLLYIMRKGGNPYEKNSKGKDAFDYQSEYGGYLTKNILAEYDRNKFISSLSSEQTKKDENLKTMQSEMSEKQKRLEELLSVSNKTPELEIEIQNLIKEITSMKDYIRSLESIIQKQAEEVKRLQNIKNLYDKELEKAANEQKTLNKNLTTHVPENSAVILPIIKNDVVIVNKVEKSVPIKETHMKDILPEISSDGDVIKDSLVLFDLLSKPIYKIEKKN